MIDGDRRTTGAERLRLRRGAPSVHRVLPPLLLVLAISPAAWGAGDGKVLFTAPPAPNGAIGSLRKASRAYMPPKLKVVFHYKNESRASKARY